MSLYRHFKNNKILLSQTRFVKVYSCCLDDKPYTIVVTRRPANKRTVLTCEGNRIVWEQIPALFNWGGSMHGERQPIY